MHTIHSYHVAHFMRLFQEGSILFFYLLALVMTVALGAYGLEVLSSAL
jgi:hypothetical protein